METTPPRRRSRAASSRRFTSRPFSSTSPVTRVRTAGSRPRIARRVTLLPEPDSPRRASTLPASSEKVTSFTARTTPSRVSKATLRSRTLRSDMVVGCPRVAAIIAPRLCRQAACPGRPAATAALAQRSAPRPAGRCPRKRRVPPLARAHNATEEQWATALQRSLLFFARMSREAVPHLKQAGGGRIVNILASTVYQPIPNLALSGATRMGVVAFAKSLADEVGRDGILVNNVCPAHVVDEDA